MRRESLCLGRGGGEEVEGRGGGRWLPQMTYAYRVSDSVSAG